MNNKKAFSLIELSIVLIIIGLVVSGIIAGKSLINSARLSNARSMTKSSIAASIENMTLWLETTSQNSFDQKLQYDDVVTSWNDINPTKTDKLNFTASGTDNEPTYQKSSYNGLPVIIFDGDADQFARDNVYGKRLVKEDEATIFIVQNNYGLVSNSSTINWAAPNNTNRLNVHAFFSNNIFFDFGDISSGGRISYSYPSPSSFYNKFNLLTLRRDGSNSIIRVNKVTDLSGSMTDSLDISVADSFTISNSFSGEIAEIIIYNRALSDTEIDDIEEYLSRKWSIY